MISKSPTAIRLSGCDKNTIIYKCPECEREFRICGKTEFSRCPDCSIGISWAGVMRYVSKEKDAEYRNADSQEKQAEIISWINHRNLLTINILNERKIVIKLSVECPAISKCRSFDIINGYKKDVSEDVLLDAFWSIEAAIIELVEELKEEGTA